MKGRIAIVLILAFASPGCMVRKKPATPVAPRAPIATAPPATPQPSVNEPAPATTPTIAPQPPKPAPRPQRSLPPAVAPAPLPQPLPPPQLGEILTSAQQAEMNRVVDQSLTPARALLARLRGRQLTSEQSETVGRIRTFAEQAEQSRKSDLRSAVQLARRAEILARDLDARIQ